MKKMTMERVSVLTVQYQQYSWEYMLDSFEKIGVKNIEMWPGEPHYCRLDYTSSGEAARRIREMKKQLDDRGIKVIMYTPETLAYPFNPAGKGDAYRNHTIDWFKWAMEDAQEFGCHNLFCNSGWGLHDEPREEAWKRAVDSFQKIAAHAKTQGITMSLEQLQPYESNLVQSARDMQKMIADVGMDNFGCCVDMGAMAVAGDTLEDFYNVLADDVVNHVHFCDANHEILGARGLPLESYIHTLEEHNYNGYLCLEIYDSMYLDCAHRAFEESYDWLRKRLPEA